MNHASTFLAAVVAITEASQPRHAYPYDPILITEGYTHHHQPFVDEINATVMQLWGFSSWARTEEEGGAVNYSLYTVASDHDPVYGVIAVNEHNNAVAYTAFQ